MANFTNPTTGANVASSFSSFTGGKDTAQEVKFPIEIDREIEEALSMNRDRPFMKFSAADSSKGDPIHIVLPIPGGVSFDDSAEYSSLDLGTIGAALDNAAQSGEEGGAKEGLRSLIKTGSSLSASELAAIASENLGFADSIGKKTLFASRKIINPQTNTTFVGNGIRTFSFAFKLIGRNSVDSNAIRTIHENFRYRCYPQSSQDNSNVVLDYPEIWTIRFFTTYEGGGENPYIPKIYDCYLTGMSTNFNSSAAMFRNDGAPVEVDFTLNFSETRNLIRNDFLLGTNLRRGKLGLL